MWFGDENFTREFVLKRLQEELKNRQSRNPSYSIRAFARDLEVDSTVLLRILKEERKISWDFATAVREHLGI